MACLDMNVNSMIMIQKKRGNRVRGGGRGMGLRGVRGSVRVSRASLGLRGVRGPGGMFRGAGRSDGHPCRGPLGLRGVRGPRGTLRGVGPRGLRGVRGPKGTFGGARHLEGHLCRGPLGLKGVRGPGGTFGGVGPLGPRGVRGPKGTFGGERQLDGHPSRGPLGMSGVRGPGGIFGGSGRSDGPPRRGMYAITKTMHGTRNLPQENGMSENRFKAVGTSGVENGTKLLVSNLDAGVSNEDIRGLFSEIGELIRYGIHYDKDGSPCGSAEVVFVRGSDAFQAMKRYNNTDLNGKPMKIEKVGSTVRAHVASRLNMIGGANGRRTARMMPRLGYMRDASVLDDGAGPSTQRGFGGWNGGVPVRGRGRHGRGRNPGGLGGSPAEKSAEELDKELENYQAGTSQT